MPATSAPNAATWRTPYSYVGKLYIDRPETIFAARVNQTTFTYPLSQVTFDTVTTGAFGSIEVGQTVLFGSTAGAADLGRQRVRLAATSTVLYIGESSDGDQDGQLNLADNMFITVINDRRLWGIPARFKDDPSNPVQYKDYDLQVSSGGRNYATDPGPKANGGADRIGELAGGATSYAFDFTDASLYVTDGSSFASRLWNVKDGTITVGSTTSASITATFPKGRRYITFRATDSNGHQHTHYILVVVTDPSDATWKPITQFEITDHRNTEGGAVLGVIIREDIPATTFYDGVEVFYYETEYYAGVAGSLAGPTTVKQVKAMGWLDLESENPEASLEDGILKPFEARIVSTAERLRQLNLLPQLLKYKESGADEWDELEALTSNRMLWYLLNWHSTATQRCQLIITSWDSEIKRWATKAGTVWEQAAECATARARKLTCDQYGVLRVLNNQQIVTAANRTATVIIALTEADYAEARLERRTRPFTYWLDGRGITLGTKKSNIKPLMSLAPGLAPGQATERTAYEGLIVTDQTELNAWTGNKFGQDNSDWLPNTVRLVHTGDIGIEPALCEWFTLTFSSTNSRRARSLTTQRCLPVEQNIQHIVDEFGRNIKVMELTFEVESSGEPGVTIERKESTQNVPPPGYDDYPIVEWNPVSGGDSFGGGAIAPGIGTIAVFDVEGYVSITTNFNDDSPTWTAYDIFTPTGTNGLPTSFVVDPFSSLYLGTGTTVDGWLSTTKKIFKIDDIFGVRTMTAQHTFATALTQWEQNLESVPNPQYNQERIIKCGWGFQDWVMCTSYYGNVGGVTGTKVAYTTDGGTTWTEVVVTAHYASFVIQIPPIHVSSKTAGLAYIRALDTTGNAATSAFYRTTDYGATWAKITSSANGPVGAANGLAGTLEVPWNDNASEKMAYYMTNAHTSAVQDYNDNIFLYRVEADGSTNTDITPLYTDGSAKITQSAGYWGLYAAPEDRRVMILAGLGTSNVTGNRRYPAVVVSRDAGDTWSVVYDSPQVTGAFTDYTQDYDVYTQAVISATGVIYCWGYDQAIGYATNFGASGIVDKKGNMSTYAPSRRFIGICGG